MTSRGRAFLFCRYTITVDDELLTPSAQLKILRELQGQPIAHRRAEDWQGQPDTLIMRPREFREQGRRTFSWSVGQLQNTRVQARYDKAADKLDFFEINDGSVKYTDFVAVPEFGVAAVDDRSGDLHIGGKQAINRFRSVIESVDGAGTSFYFQATPEEVTRALKDWNLTNLKFIVRPNNPRPVSRLAEELSEQMKRDGIGTLRAEARAPEGSTMQMSENGIIKPVADLVSAGYGQISIAGHTKDGFEAEIKKPAFHMNVERNERSSAKPRELRVYVDDDVGEDEIIRLAAKALMGFYNGQP